MTLQYEGEFEKELPFPVAALAQKVILQCLDYEQCPYEAEVNLLLTTNEEIKVLNQEYRTIDEATDVLSFPAVTYEIPGDFSKVEANAIDCFNPETGELLLGDIVISGDKVLEQANSYQHSLEREFAFLIAHSMLHLMGYDHIDEQEAQVMEAKQAEILAQLEITR